MFVYMNDNDVMLWPDGYWCFRGKWEEFGRGCNYRIVPAGCPEWLEITREPLAPFLAFFFGASHSLRASVSLSPTIFSSPSNKPGLTLRRRPRLTPSISAI